MSKQNHNIPKDYKEAEASGEQPLVGAVVGDGKAIKPESKPKNQPIVAPNGSVVSNIESHTLTKKSQIIIFVAVGVLVVASAGWLFVHRSKTSTTPETPASSAQKEAVDTVRATSGDASYAQGTSIDTSKITTVETATKVAAQLQQLGDTKNAAVVLNAVKPPETDFTSMYAYYYALGVLARVEGDNQKAIENFQKALDSIKQTPDAKINIIYVQRQVDELTVVLADLKGGN